tara:strand:- start:56400 stop:57443 length:1044 start_codon:yes stop_codon:yes gene_type:complete
LNWDNTILICAYKLPESTIAMNFKVDRILIGIRFWPFFVSLIFFGSSLWAQQKPHKVEPYTIASTYKKLKAEYPFVKPIKSLRSNKIKSKRNVVYKGDGTKKLRADMYFPKSGKGKVFPAVLLIHGGGWITGSKENLGVLAQHLALNGYVAITVSYTLSTEVPYPASVLDLKTAIAWMRANAKKYHLDPAKIAILGTSAGAQLATLVGLTPNSPIYGNKTSFSDEVQAIINIDGIVSFVHPEAHEEGKSAGIWLGGSRTENWKNWNEASPLGYAGQHSPPILFVNSAQPRFHAGRDDLVALYNDHGIYSEVHTILDSPHSFWLLHPWFGTTLGYTLGFLEKVFDPGK